MTATTPRRTYDNGDTPKRTQTTTTHLHAVAIKLMTTGVAPVLAPVGFRKPNPSHVQERNIFGDIGAETWPHVAELQSVFNDVRYTLCESTQP